MKRIISIVAIALLTFGVPVFAHGDMDHVMGTVTKIVGNVVTVEKDGKTTDVALAPFTTYEVNGAAGKQSDLTVGDRVVIHAMKMDGKETAHSVRLVHPHK
jgi:hypothetical protein